MNLFDFIDSTLPIFDWSLQLTHLTGVIVALLLGLLPLLTAKGSALHREAGRLYLALSTLVCLLGFVIAWRQGSLPLGCFYGFFAYMLLSGWRALYRPARPEWIDWGILALLLMVAMAVAVYACRQTDPRALLYFTLFAGGSFSMFAHEARLLLQPPHLATGWLNRHVAGMIGTMVAHSAVITGNFLPDAWQWALPVTLAAAAALGALHRELLRAVKTNMRRKLIKTGRTAKLSHAESR